jgi:hypothetical protein
MAKDFDILMRTAGIASKRRDLRSFLVGATGLRSDGAMVHAYNGAAPDKCAHIHAEARLCAKLDVGATVWVARATKDGSLALAKPCANCERIMRRKGVKRVIFSTGPDSYEVMNLN